MRITLLKKIKDFIRFTKRSNLSNKGEIKEKLTLSFEEAEFISDLKSLNQPKSRIEYSIGSFEGRPTFIAKENYLKDIMYQGEKLTFGKYEFVPTGHKDADGYNQKMIQDLINRLQKLDELEFIMSK